MAMKNLKDGHFMVSGGSHADTDKATSERAEQLKELERKSANDMLVDTVTPEQRVARAELLQKVSKSTMKDGWFTLSHLLLDDEAHVVDVGCGDGKIAHVMATLKPEWRFTAIADDKDDIDALNAEFGRENLTYVHAKDTDILDTPNSVDAIVSSYYLHKIYSNGAFNIQKVRQSLEKNFTALKPRGYIFIRDYALPNDNEFVLIEMKDDPTGGYEVVDMSEADLLLWFSEHARSGDSLHTGGFFVEELPPRFPNTRLFRLPYKWAYEFILRKDNREKIERDLGREYTFATHREFQRELRSLGARLFYSASHWDDDTVKKTMQNKFRLYKEDGTALGHPETSYILLGQKVPEKTSVRFQEWRQTRNAPSSIKINPVRDIKTGEVLDVATRHLEITELLPYRVSEDNRLKVYLHESIPRSLVNTVPRNGTNIDKRSWSGHMIEALAVNSETLAPYRMAKPPAIKSFVKKLIDLDVENGAILRDGPSTYPDPKTIDERFSTRYVCVKDSNPKSIELIKTKYEPPEGYPFLTTGNLREYDAQSILNAIAVGLLPSGRLESQILILYNFLNLRNESWSEMPIALTEMDVKEKLNVGDLMRDVAEDKKMFAPVKHQAGNLKLLQSVFLEEGHEDGGGGMTDLSSRAQDFFVHEETTQNVAIIMPMTRNLSGEVLVGLQVDYAPVPERFKGNGKFINLPTVPLPAHIDNMDSAKRYIAQYFQTDLKFVGTMGEPFYQHVGMTPQKVFPFAIAHNKGVNKYKSSMLTSFTPLAKIWNICALIDCLESFLAKASRCLQTAAMDSELALASKPTTELAAGLQFPKVISSYDPNFASSSDFSNMPANTSEVQAETSQEENAPSEKDDRPSQGEAETDGPSESYYRNNPSVG
ncbi:MAG: hypothetical protein CMH25_05525 [Micavibrio sp.]|nr:hypothetical protein [Micavibrio sp.]|tara:strand:- start:211305 stop:213947 length:2643 start_codon:yes stop_codon:yes gene_type:complete